MFRSGKNAMIYTAVKDIEEIRVITVLVDVIQFTNYEEVFNKVKTSINEMNCFIVLDLSKVKFMDSLSLGMLVPLLLYARRLGGDLAVMAPDPKIRELFRVLRLDQVMDTCETREEAVEYLRKEEDGDDVDEPADQSGD